VIADAELTATLIKGALASNIRGYSLMSGTVSAAQDADWLCSAMPPTLLPALLSSVALAVETLVLRKCKSAKSYGSQQQLQLGSTSGDAQPSGTS